jgi:hypothetical protein
VFFRWFLQNIKIQSIENMYGVRAVFTYWWPTVARHIFPPWPGIFFKLARCGYALRVTSQASYSPEYITSIQKKS